MKVFKKSDFYVNGKFSNAVALVWLESNSFKLLRNNLHYVNITTEINTININNLLDDDLIFKLEDEIEFTITTNDDKMYIGTKEFKNSQIEILFKAKKLFKSRKRVTLRIGKRIDIISIQKCTPTTEERYAWGLLNVEPQKVLKSIQNTIVKPKTASVVRLKTK